MLTPSQAMKRKTVKHSADVLDMEQVIALLNLPDYDELSESNWENIETRALAAYASKHGYEFDYESWEMTQECAACEGSGFTDDDRRCPACHGEGKIEIDRDDINGTIEFDEIYSEEEDPLYQAWNRAVETVLTRFLGYHGLQADPVQYRDSYLKQDGTRHFFAVHAFQIKPVTSWKAACVLLLETINGYGYHYYESPVEFLNSQPYTSYKQAVLDNLGMIEHAADVYDYKTPERLYSSELEIRLYNW